MCQCEFRPIFKSVKHEVAKVDSLTVYSGTGLQHGLGPPALHLVQRSARSDGVHAPLDSLLCALERTRDRLTQAAPTLALQ